MGRPAENYRLSAIKPDEVAARAVQLASSRTSLAAPSDPLEVDLGRKALRLTQYAQGTSAMEATEVRSLIYDVCRGTFGYEQEEAPVPTNSLLGLVILGARGRMKLTESPPRPVTTTEMAALANTHQSTIRRLSGKGERLERASVGMIDPKSAARFLAESGDKGFAPAE